MAAEWYVNVDGEPHGPLATATLMQKVQDGTITQDTLIRLGGSGAWTAAGEMAELIGLETRATAVSLASDAVPGTVRDNSPGETPTRASPQRPVVVGILATCAFLCGICGTSYWITQ